MTVVNFDAEMDGNRGRAERDLRKVADLFASHCGAKPAMTEFLPPIGDVLTIRLLFAKPISRQTIESFEEKLVSCDSHGFEGAAVLTPAIASITTS